MNIFRLNQNSEFIELSAFLKITQLAQTGGQAKIMIKNNFVKVNGKTETRKRVKLRHGDIIEINHMIYKIEQFGFDNKI